MRSYYKIVFLLLAACASEPAEVSTEGTAEAHRTPNAEFSETTDANGLIAVTRAGSPDGRDVVLVPGLASGPEVWSDTVAAMPDYDYSIVHVAGFAGREAPNEADDITEFLAAELAALAGELDTPVLVGHSMGGFLSLKAGLLKPDAVSSIVVVDSLPFLSEIMLPGQTPEQAAVAAAAMRDGMKSMPRDAFEAQQAAGVPRMAKSEEAHQRIRKAMADSDQAVVATAMSELLAADLRPELADLAVPVTVLMPWDPLMGIPEQSMRELYTEQYAKAPDVDVVTVKNSFHFVMDDQPEAFRAELGRLLED